MLFMTEPPLSCFPEKAHAGDKVSGGGCADHDPHSRKKTEEDIDFAGRLKKREVPGDGNITTAFPVPHVHWRRTS